MNAHADIRQDLATAVPTLTDRQIATIEALITKQRSATVEYNPIAKSWMVRCYGRGNGTIARGMPTYNASEARSRDTAAVWIRSGEAPADQVHV
jgi:hypothetical protein